MSPELLEGKISKQTDVWAIGCIIVQFLTGELPYHGISNEISVSMKIVSGVTPLIYAEEKLK